LAYSHKHSNDIHISNTSGDVFGVGISGFENVIGHDVVGTREISLDVSSLSKIPTEYADCLKSFVEVINREFLTRSIRTSQIGTLQTRINEFIVLLADTNPRIRISFSKRRDLTAALVDIIKVIVAILPLETRYIISLFTPLSPIGSLIGENIGQLVEDVRRELQ
jgi:hypothetical protein